MTWIESHDAVINHPKTRKLARRLDVEIPTAVGLLHCLWHWAVDYAEDGNLSKHDAEDIALGSHWSGDPDDFLKALIDSRWVDREGEELRLHDWSEYAGKLLERRRADRERKAASRGRSQDGRDVSAGTPEDGARTPPTSPTEQTSPPPTEQTVRGTAEVEAALNAAGEQLRTKGFSDDAIAFAVEETRPRMVAGEIKSCVGFMRKKARDFKTGETPQRKFFDGAWHTYDRIRDKWIREDEEVSA